MYSINNKNKCQIYGSSVYQDLIGYTIGQDITGPYIKYDGISTNYPVTLNMSAIESFVNASSVKDVWLPAIIQDETYISHKVLFNKQNITNKILGIENVISFDAKLKNWDTLDTGGGSKSINMSTNWYVTSMAPFFKAQYGLLFWYKINETLSTRTYLLKDIPNGTVIKSSSSLSYADNSQSIDSSIIVMKIDNSTLKRLDKQNNRITGTGIDFWYEPQMFDLSKCASFDIDVNQFSLDINNQLSKGGNDYSIWISDGEAFSYFGGAVDEIRSRNRGLVSKTYLSHILMPIYREIYNILTLKRNRAYSPYLSKKQALCLQKLCYFLSTHPLIDRTTVSVLNKTSIYDAVLTYLDTSQTDQASEITELKNILNTVSTEYKNQNLSQYNNKQTNRYNYINNTRELVQRILGKYGGQLRISDDSVLKYKSKLPNGAHAILGLDTYSLFSKTEPSSTVLYNNCKIDIGNIHYSTDISTTGSIIKLSGDSFSSAVEIPLVDIGVKRYRSSPFYLGVGKTATFTAGQETIVRDIYPGGGGYDGTYYWEQISGPPCLRFTDWNKDRFRVLRFKTSTDYNPDIYIRESGTYRLKCTLNQNGMIESDEVVITTNGSLDSAIDISSISEPEFNKIVLSVPNRIGFHKHGLVWFIDTENYVRDDNALQARAELGEIFTFKLKDIKIDFTKDQTLIPMQSNADLSFSFLAANGNTTMLVNSISIENARYKNNDTSQCTSFYQEKTYRDPRSPFLPILGASNFTVTDGFQYYLAYYSNNGIIYGKTSLLSNPATVSTSLSPDVLSYGGYSQQKVDNIGIYMPGHPIGNGTNILPILDRRNQITEPTGVYCHLREVQPVGIKHFVSFSKGFFDPTIGWKEAT